MVALKRRDEGDEKAKFNVSLVANSFPNIVTRIAWGEVGENPRKDLGTLHHHHQHGPGSAFGWA